MFLFLVGICALSNYTTFLLITIKLTDKCFQLITHSVLLWPIKGNECEKTRFFNGSDDQCNCFSSKSSTELSEDTNGSELQYFVKKNSNKIQQRLNRQHC